MTLSVLTLQAEPLLRALQTAAGEGLTLTGLAKRLDRDVSNVRRSLAACEGAGLVGFNPLLTGLSEEGHRQLAALDRAANEGATSDLVGLRHDQIAPDPDNARSDWTSAEAKAELQALAEDIADRGLLQNLNVRARDAAPTPDDWYPTAPYVLIGGERRWRAVDLLIQSGRWPAEQTLQCRLNAGDALELRLTALAENLLRRKLNPIEKARGFEQLAELGLGNKAIADRLGFTPEHIQQHRRLFKLDPADQARMALPSDDPDHLSLSEARRMLAGPSPTPGAPEPPKRWSPDDLPPAERLVLAEFVHAVSATGGYLGIEIPVAADAREHPLAKALADAEVLSFTDEPRAFGAYPGHYLANIHGWPRVDACRAAWPDLTGDDLRDVALRKLQLELNGALPDGATYVTPWLNGPFALTPEGEAIVAERRRQEAERAAREAEHKAQREAAEARAAEARKRLLEALNAAAEAAPSDIAAPTQEAASGVGHPLPWSLQANGVVVDAVGQSVTSFGDDWGADDADMTLGQLIVLSVNTAAGLPTPPIVPVDEADEDNDEQDEDDSEPSVASAEEG